MFFRWKSLSGESVALDVIDKVLIHVLSFYIDKIAF